MKKKKAMVLGILNQFVEQETARAKGRVNPPLPEYFDSEDDEKNNDWKLTCKKCGKGWRLSKDSNHPGNILHLLNHARSHG